MNNSSAPSYHDKNFKFCPRNIHAEDCSAFIYADLACTCRARFEACHCSAVNAKPQDRTVYNKKTAKLFSDALKIAFTLGFILGLTLAFLVSAIVTKVL